MTMTMTMTMTIARLLTCWRRWHISASVMSPTDPRSLLADLSWKLFNNWFIHPPCFNLNLNLIFSFFISHRAIQYVLFFKLLVWHCVVTLSQFIFTVLTPPMFIPMNQSPIITNKHFENRLQTRSHECAALNYPLSKVPRPPCLDVTERRSPRRSRRQRRTTTSGGHLSAGGGGGRRPSGADGEELREARVVADRVLVLQPLQPELLLNNEKRKLFLIVIYAFYFKFSF